MAVRNIETQQHYTDLTTYEHMEEADSVKLDEINRKKYLFFGKGATGEQDMRPGSLKLIVEGLPGFQARQKEVEDPRQGSRPDIISYYAFITPEGIAWNDLGIYIGMREGSDKYRILAKERRIIERYKPPTAPRNLVFLDGKVHSEKNTA